VVIFELECEAFHHHPLARSAARMTKRREVSEAARRTLLLLARINN
jgi:hypothetical protein